MKAQFLALLIIVPLLITACSKNEADDNSITHDSMLAVPEQNLISFYDYRTIEPTDMASEIPSSALAYHYLDSNETMLAILGQAFKVIQANRLSAMDRTFSISPLKSRRNWAIHSYAYTYHSLSAKGEPIVLSGRVSFPALKDGSPHKVQSFSLIHHFLLHTHPQAPSLDRLSPYSMRTFYNSAVIEPDLEGYAVSREGHCFPGFSFMVQARQQADGIRAAIQLLRQLGITLATDGYSTVWGGSLATPGAMAFVRYYDEELPQQQRNQIRLKSAYMGCGPMLPLLMIQYINEHPEYDASGLCYLPAFFNAVDTSLLGGYQLSDFFPYFLHTDSLNVEGTTMSYYDAITQYRVIGKWPSAADDTDIASFFADDMLTADRRLDYDAPKTRILLDLLEQLTSWGSWLPQEPVYLTHSPADNYIPYAQIEAFVQQMQASPNFHFKELNTLPPTSLVSAHAGSTAITLFATILQEDPALAFRYSQFK